MSWLSYHLPLVRVEHAVVMQRWLVVHPASLRDDEPLVPRKGTI